jgi:hypothetical protein
MSSGYKNAPEYGGPEPSGLEYVLWIISVAAIAVVIWRVQTLWLAL